MECTVWYKHKPLIASDRTKDFWRVGCQNELSCRGYCSQKSNEKLLPQNVHMLLGLIDQNNLWWFIPKDQGAGKREQRDLA